MCLSGSILRKHHPLYIRDVVCSDFGLWRVLEPNSSYTKRQWKQELFLKNKETYNGTRVFEQQKVGTNSFREELGPVTPMAWGQQKGSFQGCPSQQQPSACTQFLFLRSELLQRQAHMPLHTQLPVAHMERSLFVGQSTDPRRCLHLQELVINISKTKLSKIKYTCSPTPAPMPQTASRARGPWQAELWYL